MRLHPPPVAPLLGVRLCLILQSISSKRPASALPIPRAAAPADTVHCLRGDTVTVNVRLQAFGADGGSQMLADPKPLPPWEWRASERERKAAAVPSGQ